MGVGISFTRRPATGHYRRGQCLVTPILDSWISDLIKICAQTHFRVCREGFGTLAHPESATPPERNIIAWRRWSVTEAPEIPPAKVMSAKTMRRFNKIPARRGTCGQKPEARNLRAVSEVDSRLPAPQVAGGKKPAAVNGPPTGAASTCPFSPCPSAQHRHARVPHGNDEEAAGGGPDEQEDDGERVDHG